jgi:cytidine deaminase
MGKIVSQKVEFTEHEAKTDLPLDFQNLLSHAEAALETSYSVYSGFRVGAAILLENGAIVLGSNQENIAYPSGMCAERVALFGAGTQFPKVTIRAIAITAESVHGKLTEPVTPCGSCRQVMIESEIRQNTPFTVIMSHLNGKVWTTSSVAQLIPFYFSSPFLPKIG